MSNIEGLIRAGLQEYELLQESDYEIEDLVNAVQGKIDLVLSIQKDYSVEKCVESVLDEKNREIDLSRTYSRYQKVMTDYGKSPTGIRKFKLAKGSRVSPNLNSPFARFQEAEKLGLVKGTRVLLSTDQKTGEFEVEHMTPICLIKLVDERNPVSPFCLANLDK